MSLSGPKSTKLSQLRSVIVPTVHMQPEHLQPEFIPGERTMTQQAAVDPTPESGQR